jgi:hypothetical protein
MIYGASVCLITIYMLLFSFQLYKHPYNVLQFNFALNIHATVPLKFAFTSHKYHDADLHYLCHHDDDVERAFMNLLHFLHKGIVGKWMIDQDVKVNSLAPV